MIVSTLEIQLRAPTHPLAQDLRQAGNATSSYAQTVARQIADVERHLGVSFKQLQEIIAAERLRESVFAKGFGETLRLLALVKTGAENTSKALADLKINPRALRVPDQAYQSLTLWREKLAYALGEGAVLAADKVQSAWESVKETTQRQVVIWGVALAAGVSAAVIAAVYAAYKGIGFVGGLLTGSSYKSENIDALIAMNREVKTLQEELPLTATGASALNEALKAQGVSAEQYIGTMTKASAAVRANREELGELGVWTRDYNGELLTTEQTLENALTVIQSYAEGWDRQQAAAAIGMGSEKEIQAALSVTAEKTQVAKERLMAYGLVIGPETQKAVTQYEQSMRAFQRESDLTGQGFRRAIADNIMPLLTDLADFFRDGFPVAVRAFRYSMATVTSLFYGLKTAVFIVAESILGAIESMGLGLGGLATAAAKALKGDFGGAKDALVQGWMDAKNRLGQIGENIVEQARRNADAMRLAWGVDSLGAVQAADVQARAGGRRWQPKQQEEEEQAASAAKVNAEYERLMKSIAERTALMQAELAGREKLTEAEQIAMRAMVGLRDGTLQLSEAEKILLRVALERMLATDKDLRLKKQAEDDTKASIALIDQQIAQAITFAEQINEMRRAHSENVKALTLEAEHYEAETAILRVHGLSTAEVTKRMQELTIAKEVQLRTDRLRREEIEKIRRLEGEELVIARQAAAIMAETDRQIAELAPKIREALSARGARDEAQRFNDEVKRIGDSLNDSLTDGLMRGFESGKDIAGNFIDTLKNAFKSLVLRPVIQWILWPITGAVAPILAGLSGNAMASGGATGGGVNPLNLVSTGNNFFGTSPISMATNLAGNTLAGAGFLGSSPMFGAVGGAELAAIAALEGGGVASLGMSAAAGLGMAVPIIGGVIAAAGLLGGLFGGKKAPAVGTGYTFTGSYGRDMQGLLLSLTGQTTAGPHPMPAAGHIADLTKQIEQSLVAFENVARQMGIGTEAFAKTRVDFGFTSSRIGQAGQDEAYAAVAAQVVEGMAKALIPGLEDFQKEGESIGDTFTRVATEMKLVEEMLELVGMQGVVAFQGLGKEAIELRNELVELMGGLQGATTLTQSFFENFFTQEEQFRLQTERMHEALEELGVTSLPQTRLQFRALVEAQDLTTEAGREMFAGLMALAPAFAAVTQTIEDAALAAGTLAGQISTTQSAALQAVQDQISASRAAASAASQAADRYRGISEALRDAIDRISGRAGSVGDFQALMARARTGDADALGSLPAAADAVLTTARANAQTLLEFERQRARILVDLEQARIASDAMVNWNEYQAQLLEAQGNTLEAIRAQLELPAPDLDILRQHTAILDSIAGLLLSQTAQIVSGDEMQAVLLHDATGRIARMNVLGEEQVRSLLTVAGITTNLESLTADQLGALLTSDTTLSSIRSLTADQLAELLGVGRTQEEIEALTSLQTSQIITGNAVQDAIRNLQARESGFTEELLRSLVIGDSMQTSNMQQTVSLLQQLVALTEQKAAEDAAAELARIRAQEAAAAAAAAAAIAAAEAAARAAEEAQRIAALKALFEQARWTTSQAALAAVFNSDVARQFFEAKGITGLSLNEQFEALKAYAQSHASGLSYVPHDDYFARLHEGEAVLTRSEAATWRGRNTTRLEEQLERLTEKVDELTAITRSGVRHQYDTAKTLRRWDGDGIPDEREMA